MQTAIKAKVSPLRALALLPVALFAGCLHGRSYYAKQYEAEYLPQCSITRKVPVEPETPDEPGRASLSKEMIRRVISSHVSEVRRCYEDAMFPWPALEGRVQVRFLIGHEGRVTAVDLVETSVTPGLSATGCCVARAVRTWTFPKPDGAGGGRNVPIPAAPR